MDSAGQIHLEKTGFSMIPGVDEYEIVPAETRKEAIHQDSLFFFLI